MPLVKNSYPFSSICSDLAKCLKGIKLHEADFPFLSCYVEILLFFFLISSEHVNKFAKISVLFQLTGKMQSV